MGYKIRFDVHANGQVRKADVIVTDEAGTVCTTARVQAFDSAERQKLVKQLAKRLKVDPSKLEEPIEAGWAQTVDRLVKDKAKKEAEGQAQVDADGTDRTDRTGPSQGEYLVRDGAICRKRHDRDGGVSIAPLCNFTAKIVQQVIHDDGVERKIQLAIEGKLAGGRELPRVEVAAEKFGSIDWILPSWGTGAIHVAGQGSRDHLRAAMQHLSGHVPTKVVFGHIGWRKLGEKWVYLHAGGGIGSDGVVSDIVVEPPGSLDRFVLPAPLTGDQLVNAVQASLGLFKKLTLDRIVAPLLGAVARAVLGQVDFALHMSGETGVFKSELAALGQQHFGAGMVRLKLPGGWTSTDNAMEQLGFGGKDALVVFDDFAPRGSTFEVQSYHRKADRLVRSLGNGASRMRMWADGTMRPEKPPRCTALITGEDVPAGASVRARLCVIEIDKGDVDVVRLDQCQRDAAAGLYAAAMSGFVCWLAPQLDEVQRQLRQEHAELRNRAAAQGQHRRAPAIVADLALGLRYFFNFARQCGAIAPEERDALVRRCWKALLEAAVTQAEHVRDADPTDMYLRLLRAAITSGAGHLASPDGISPPPGAEGWGWEGKEITTKDGADLIFVPRGARIGWIDDDAGDVFLQPDATYAIVQETARKQGSSLAIAEPTLRKRLKTRGLLASHRKDKLTLRRVLSGQVHEVIHLRVDTLLGKPVRPVRPVREDPNPPADQGVTNGPIIFDRVVAGPDDGPTGPIDNTTGPNDGPTGPNATHDGTSTCDTAGPVGPVGPVSTGGGDLWSADDVQEGSL